MVAFDQHDIGGVMRDHPRDVFQDRVHDRIEVYRADQCCRRIPQRLSQKTLFVFGLFCAQALDDFDLRLLVQHGIGGDRRHLGR